MKDEGRLSGQLSFSGAKGPLKQHAVIAIIHSLFKRVIYGT